MKKLFVLFGMLALLALLGCGKDGGGSQLVQPRGLASEGDSCTLNSDCGFYPWQCVNEKCVWNGSNSWQCMTDLDCTFGRQECVDHQCVDKTFTPKPE